MAEYVKEIIIGAIAGLLVIGLEIFLRWLKTKLLNKSIRNFWEFTNKKVVIVYPVYHQGGQIINELLAGKETVISLHLLTTFFKDNKIDYFFQTDSNQIPKDYDVILLCSPKGNRHSREFVKNIVLPFNIEPINNGSKSFCYYDSESQISYRSPMDRSIKKNVDIGMITRYIDKQNNRKVFFFWGIHAPGTLGAVKFAVNPSDLRGISKEVKDRSFRLSS